MEMAEALRQTQVSHRRLMVVVVQADRDRSCVSVRKATPVSSASLVIHARRIRVRTMVNAYRKDPHSCVNVQTVFQDKG